MPKVVNMGSSHESLMKIIRSNHYPHLGVSDGDGSKFLWTLKCQAWIKPGCIRWIIGFPGYLDNWQDWGFNDFLLTCYFTVNEILSSRSGDYSKCNWSVCPITRWEIGSDWQQRKQGMQWKPVSLSFKMEAWLDVNVMWSWINVNLDASPMLLLSQIL